MAVHPRTASQIWLVAVTAACRRGMPSRTWRAMFSTTTMESSTSSPSATTKPAMDSWLSEKPVKYSAARPMASDSGMDSITMPAARRPSGSSVSATRLMASVKSKRSRESRWSTLRDWSKPRSRRTPSGSWGSKASSRSQMPSRTSKTFWLSFMFAVTNTARSPLKRPR